MIKKIVVYIKKLLKKDLDNVDSSYYRQHRHARFVTSKYPLIYDYDDHNNNGSEHSLAQMSRSSSDDSLISN